MFELGGYYHGKYVAYDEILLLESGAIVGHGSHEELLLNSPEYY